MSNLLVGLVILIFIGLYINQQYKFPLHIPMGGLIVYYILTNGCTPEIKNTVIPGNTNMIHTELPDF
jgi:C4-dicarboxylate transporter